MITTPTPQPPPTKAALACRGAREALTDATAALDAAEGHRTPARPIQPERVS